MQRSTWDDFHSGAPIAAARPEILTSWRRSRGNHVNPERLDIEHREVDHESALVRAGAPVLLGMADLLAGTSTSLALTDTAGTVTWRWVSEPSLRRLLDGARFESGSVLDEPLAGTNGIGVALTTRRPAVVLGAEHYKEAWHRFACAAAPVVHPVTRRIVGAVNVACRATDANHLLQVTLRSLVHEIRTALHDAATGRQRRLIDAYTACRANSLSPVIALDRQTMIADDRAGALNLDRAELWEAIREAGPRATTVPVGDGLLARAFPVTPGRLEDGVVLVVHRDEPGSRATGPSARGLAPPPPQGTLARAERETILAVLDECRGNKSQAAARLGISRGTLYQRLTRYGLHAPFVRSELRPPPALAAPQDRRHGAV